MRGKRYLARLLANPGREFHVVDLVGLEQGGRADTTHVTEPGSRFRDAGDAGEMLDALAKEAYRRRLTACTSSLMVIISRVSTPLNGAVDRHTGSA